MVNVPLLNPNATKREYFWLWTLTLIENFVALSIEVQATYSIGSSHLPYIVRTRYRHYKIGNPARLPAQPAGRRGQRN